MQQVCVWLCVYGICYYGSIKKSILYSMKWVNKYKKKKPFLKTNYLVYLATDKNRKLNANVNEDYNAFVCKCMCIRYF